MLPDAPRPCADPRPLSAAERANAGRLYAIFAGWLLKNWPDRGGPRCANLRGDDDATQVFLALKIADLAFPHCDTFGRVELAEDLCAPEDLGRAAYAEALAAIPALLSFHEEKDDAHSAALRTLPRP